MMNLKSALACALLVLLTSCAAPVEGYFNSADQITESWSATLGTTAIGGGNGAFMSLDGQTLAVISRNCYVNAYDPGTGTEKWKYMPTDATLMCTGGLWFAGSSVYFSPDSATSSFVTVLNLADGVEVFTTAAVDGMSTGTPVTSSDGKYIAMTTNPTLSTGLFTVFDSANPSTPVLSYLTVESRFSAIGAYWMPIEGHFVEGFGNSNDAFYFGLDISLDDANITVGDGQMYAYQAGDANVTPIGDVRSFQSGLPPVIANSGLNMYWSVARSQVRCWAGTADLKRTAFDVGSIGSVELERGNPPYLAAKAPPVVTAGATPFAYGPSAANEIYGLNFDCSAVSNYTFPDISLVLSNKVLLSNDELYLYAATPAGEVWFLDAANLGAGPIWTYPLTVPVAGELAISLDGLHIFVPDVNGIIHALLVNESPVPGSTSNITGPAPTLAPILVGGELPTVGNGTVPTLSPFFINGTVPTLSPLLVNTSAPSMSLGPTASVYPSSNGTELPTISPVSALTGSPSPPVSALTEAPVFPVSVPTEEPVPPVSAPTEEPVPLASAPTETITSTASVTSVSSIAAFGVLLLAAFSMILD